MKNSTPIKRLSLIASGVALSTCFIAVPEANASLITQEYLGKINYILASKIVQHFFNVSEEALSVFIGAKFNPFIF